ncbi:hypothetical protein GEV33_001982 [Tenebrio molitor]|uniref:Cytochrome P450 monooxygenase n=1 Tax=Tenebrio molitor TaxID=7067 RepID=A0A8J6LF84_TENMO|nr:hypothetical protein GEV33_001982 [Tenebrio molitor]
MCSEKYLDLEDLDIKLLTLEQVRPLEGFDIFLRSPELVKRVLVKDFDKFVNRNVARNQSADPLAFHTVFISKDEIWRCLRSRFSSAFTPLKMKMMSSSIKECAENLSCYLSSHNGETLEVKCVMKKFSTDITSSYAFGIETMCLHHEDSEIFKMATRLVDTTSFIRSVSILSYFFLPRLVDIFKLTFLDKPATDYFCNLFKETLKLRQKSKIVRNDFLDILINFSNSEVTMDSYDCAGSDTIAITLSLTFYELALNKVVQDRLRTELREAVHEKGPPTCDMLENVKYLDMVVSEILRKYPLAPILNRRAETDYLFEETGFTLDKGVSILVPVSGLHYDPDFFPDPYKYDPERFSEENRSKIKPYTYLPFGDGPRNCIELAPQRKQTNADDNLDSKNATEEQLMACIREL